MLRFRNLFAATVICTALSGCSYGYRVEAIYLEGGLAFSPAETDFWGDPDPDCFHDITVSREESTEGDVTPGDRIAWKRYFDSQPCANDFPVVYGAPLVGTPSSLSIHDVEAQPLEVGVIYIVQTGSETIGYGNGRFKLDENGMPINLPYR